MRRRRRQRRFGTYRVCKGAEIYQHRVKSYNTHGLQRITVDNVTRDHRVPDLYPGGTWNKVQSIHLKTQPTQVTLTQEKCNLPNHPMIALVDANPPKDQTN